MTARYLVGDVLEVLPTLEENSVDLILTSPPFLALRSYLPADHPLKSKEGGSQPTPGAFIDWLVDVVEALDRVLAPHGSMVIELGDTYAGNAPGDQYQATAAWHDGRNQPQHQRKARFKGEFDGWPADKSLTLIPELFRMTLVYGFNPLTGRQTKRWRLRNVIRWVRPNPPVGALGDKFRPATSELMVFCRTDEAGRKRYFDLDSVRTPMTEATEARNAYPFKVTATMAANPNHGDHGREGLPINSPMNPAGAPPLDRWNIPLLDGEEETPNEPAPRKTGGRPTPKYDGNRVPNTGDRGGGSFETHELGSPPLDWWNIPPGGFSGAHYAVFPEALCVRPIKAMCPERVCRTCGEASRRIVDVSYTPHGDDVGRQNSEAYAQATMGQNPSAQAMPFGRATKNVNTLGWSDCSHDNYRPGLVLDPFAGSGTTLAVAVGHGRDAVGIDLDERNARLAEERIGFFLEVVQ